MNRKLSYNYCGICGRVPGKNEEPNYAPIGWWDPDDGWKVGTLCRWCHEEVKDDKPQPRDYAYNDQDKVDVNTDEDVLDALGDLF